MRRVRKTKRYCYFGLVALMHKRIRQHAISRLPVSRYRRVDIGPV